MMKHIICSYHLLLFVKDMKVRHPHNYRVRINLNCSWLDIQFFFLPSNLSILLSMFIKSISNSSQHSTSPSPQKMCFCVSSGFPISLEVYKQLGIRMLLPSIHFLIDALCKHGMSEGRSLWMANGIEKDWQKPNFQKRQVPRAIRLPTIGLSDFKRCGTIQYTGTFSP